jgi:hypothetical protein
MTCVEAQIEPGACGTVSLMIAVKLHAENTMVEDATA